MCLNFSQIKHTFVTFALNMVDLKQLKYQISCFFIVFLQLLQKFNHFDHKM